MDKPRKSLFWKLQQNWGFGNKWFLDTPQRALLIAYEAALRIYRKRFILLASTTGKKPENNQLEASRISAKSFFINCIR